MKKFLLGCAAVVVSAGTSFATDFPARAPSPIYKAAPAYSWSGFYAGVHGGYGWGENDVVDLTGATSIYNFKPAGGFGGLQIGYNSHFAPHWLIGGEIDGSWGDISDSRVDTAGLVNGSSKFDYFGSARTRFGYVQDRSLLYVTGGVAWTHDKFQNAPTNGSHYLVGWTLGAGWEYAIDNRWSAKIEYLYADFNDNRDVGPLGGGARTFDTNLSTVRVGLNYRFGEMAAAPAYMPVKAAAVRSSWDGGYMGVHGGYGSSHYDVSGGGVVSSLEPKGGFGGFQSGANWQFAPNWVFGLETDGSYGDLKDDNAAVRVKLNGIGTARARLGYGFDNVLLYATGGAAYGREKSTLTGTNENKTDHFGWTAGAGVEYKFAPEWSWKVEYLYADLGENDFKNPGAFGHNTRFTVDTVKVGVNYYGPLIERLFTK